MNSSNWNMTMKQNTSAATLSCSQHNALFVLSKYRHAIHCSQKDIIASSEKGIRLENFLQRSLPVMLHAAGLPALDISCELDALDFCLRASCADQVLKTTILSSLLETINVKIEEYLREMDWLHGTTYAPSGVSRIRRMVVTGGAA